jgi:hypothetical protein
MAISLKHIYSILQYPVPLKGTPTVPVGALELMFRVPVFEPVEVGVNLKVTVQLCPGAIEEHPLEFLLKFPR